MNKSIQGIDLRNNDIRQDCAHSLANIIKDSVSLQHLDLRWNELGNEGARIMIPAIKSKKGKLKVELDGNSVSEELLASMEMDEIPDERPSPIFANTGGSVSKIPQSKFSPSHSQLYQASNYGQKSSTPKNRSF